MNHLLRELAPISARGWKLLDEEARERLVPQLAARRVVDVTGPHGWAYSATNLGRVRPVAGIDAGEAVLRQRQVLPLVEVRVPFVVSRAELDDADRGAVDLEFDDVDRAARELALIENRAVFHGWEAAGIIGVLAAAPHPVQALGTDADAYPHVVAKAVDLLREKGIGGPFALAIEPDGYRSIVETAEQGGLLVMDHLRRVLGDGQIVRTPGLTGAAVLNLAGGDFVLELGQDLSVGYSHHDADTVSLYLEESFSFRVTEPDAAVALR